jgi:excinuclease ABC subunit A
VNRQPTIQLRGVRVHNLQRVDLDIPRRQLVVVCGLSGSGKSSLAFDTLYAEGQRRYIESFSPYTRQFLESLERPAADRIEGIPPAVAVSRQRPSTSRRATIGTATEIVDHLRLLVARVGQVFCHQCAAPIRVDTPQSAAKLLETLPPGTRYLVVFPIAPADPTDLARRAMLLREEGFVRVVVGENTLALDEPGAPTALAAAVAAQPDLRVYAVVDRLTAGASSQRVRDSLETAFVQGEGECLALVEQAEVVAAVALGEDSPQPQIVSIEGRTCFQLRFFSRRRCGNCGLESPAPEPRLLSFNHPQGACPACEGFGDVAALDMSLVVPDNTKSLREGAIAPWNVPDYAQHQQALFALAGKLGIALDVPFRQLDPSALRLIHQGAPEHGFVGLDRFFGELETQAHKLSIRGFLARWRSRRTCSACGGSRLRPEAQAVKLGGLNIVEICRLKVRDAAAFFRALPLDDYQRTVGRTMLAQIQARLDYLQQVGLDYLTLDRPLPTLSSGEAQRVALTSALGASLVNLLYVLDEPSTGLHPLDTVRLLSTVQRLRDRGNSVVVVEHDEAFLRAADQVIELGPGAGDQGGRVIFQGSPADLIETRGSPTGDYLAGRRLMPESKRRATQRGWIRLIGARGNNLHNLTVDFPLGVLCAVTGVSGAGKSSLVQETLYPALCRRLNRQEPAPLPFDDLYGAGQIGDVVLVDQSPISRSPRSNPVTYVKAFDGIRDLFAQAIESRTRNYPPSHFSFNVPGGRCEHCEGAGQLQVDMQFLGDVFMRCPQCQGARYRREILDVKHRGLSIAEVLDLTVRQAFSWFRGQTQVQSRLKRLMDVGLDYVRLGQPANTLSGGEAQRLKLAGHLASARKKRTLFLLDEPTAGLHFSDVVKLLDCFDALLAEGHSLIVVEHNLQLIRAADYLIDIGPGAADEGGRVVVHGPPDVVAASPNSATGRALAQLTTGSPRLV